MKPRLRADLMLASVTLIWGMNFSIIKDVYTCFDPLAFTTLRFIVAVVALYAVLRWRGISLSVDRRDFPALLGFGVLSNTVYQVLFVIGLAGTRAGNAGLLMASSPVFAYLTGVVLKRETFRRRILLGILLSMAGVSAVIAFGPEGISLGSASRGDLLILLSAICWGCYTGASARLILKYGALRLTFWVMLTGTVGMVLFLAPFLIRQDWRSITVRCWLGFLYSALLAIVFGYITWSYALQHLGVSRTAVYSNVTPLLALLGGWMLLGEQPVAAQLAGIGMILSGVYLVRTRRGGWLALRKGVRLREWVASRKAQPSPQDRDVL
jgi:drug/metabolite transporter (DMT)-like permease